MPQEQRSRSGGPSFPERVYAVVLQIPEGKVTTYGTIAAVLGERRSARMVGWAMSSCPPEVSEVAHRVVNRYGELSGGWAFGHPDIMKQHLLDEGVTFVEEYRVDLEKHFWLPPMPDIDAESGCYTPDGSEGEEHL